MTFAEACTALEISERYAYRMHLVDVLQGVPGNQRGLARPRYTFDPVAVAVFGMLRAMQRAISGVDQVRRRPYKTYESKRAAQAKARTRTIETSTSELPEVCPHTTRPVDPASCSQCRGAIPLRLSAERMLDDVDTDDVYYVNVSSLGRMAS